MNPPKTIPNGFEAFEAAWDKVAERFWSVFAFNLLWLGALGFAMLLLIVLCLAIRSYFLLIMTIVFGVLIVPVYWEAANIIRYGSERKISSQDVKLSHVFWSLILARFLFLVITILGYLLLILPGIYLSCRLCLYIVDLCHNPNQSAIGSLCRSWRLTKANFVSLYTLWIAITVIPWLAAMPMGIGLLIERPVTGLAKEVMYLALNSESG